MKQSNTRIRAVVLILAFIIFTWMFWPGINRCWYKCNYAGAIGGVAEHGQFGDSFGSLNSLFTGLAFVGAVYAVLLQREGLRVQVLQFDESQRNQRLVDELSVLEAILERVDNKLARTEGVISQDDSAAKNWELGQRQRWLEQRRTLENRMADISDILGWKLPITTPPKT